MDIGSLMMTLVTVIAIGVGVIIVLMVGYLLYVRNNQMKGM